MLRASRRTGAAARGIGLKTFLDAGVLLTAWRGRDPEAALA